MTATQKKRGRTPLEVDTRPYTLMLDPKDAEVSKDFPGGLSALVRRFLGDVRKAGGKYPSGTVLSTEAVELLEDIKNLPPSARTDIEKLIKSLAVLAKGESDFVVDYVIKFGPSAHRLPRPVVQAREHIDVADNSTDNDATMFEAAMFAEMEERGE